MNCAVRGVLRHEWQGTEAELRELSALPMLATTNWREELHRMQGLAPLGKYRSARGRLRDDLLAKRGAPALALVALFIMAGALLVQVWPSSPR